MKNHDEEAKKRREQRHKEMRAGFIKNLNALIGRINRINKKMFDNIYIFNFFPTDIGEQNTLIKGISTLKMLLINNIVGSDTRTLTPDETLQSYFKKQYEEANEETGEKSWDNDYKNIYNAVKHNMTLIDAALNIPERARIVRKGQFEPCAISFAKRGNNTLFAMASDFDKKAQIVPPERILSLFKAEPDEKSYEYDQELDKKFAILRDEIKKPYPKVNLDKRKGQAIDNLEKLLAVYPVEKDYISDLLEVIKNYDDLSDGELKYSGVSIFSNKIRCADCGSWYGSKVWHSTDAYKKTIYRCNHKYNGDKCKTPHVTEDEVKVAFVSAYNQLVSEKAEIIANTELIRRTLCVIDALVEEKERLEEEMRVVVEMTQSIVAENARIALNQDDYQKRYDGLVARYDTAKARYDEVVAAIADKEARGERLANFIRTLKERDGIIKEFDSCLWGGMVDYVTVARNKTIVVTFKDGTEIQV